MDRMIERVGWLVGVVALVAVPVLAAGAGDGRGGPAAAGPEAAVDRFYAALAAGDRAAALAELAPELVVFEQGGAELSREEYAAEHLGADMEFLAATESRIVERRSGGDGATGWVLTRSETTGTYQDAPVAVHGTETMVLERRPEGWRIVHIHWSSRRKAE